VHGKRQHILAELGRPPLGVNRPDIVQQAIGLNQMFRVRRLNPGKRI
jgi:hypothetical protein